MQSQRWQQIGVAEIMGFVFEKVENIVGKGENVGYQKASYPGSFKVRIVWLRVKDWFMAELKFFSGPFMMYQ